MITYRHNGLNPFSITVKLDGVFAGQILKDVDGTYYYRAKNGDEGQRFEEVEYVKYSIEGTCPGHIARDDDPMICRFCGTHADEERDASGINNDPGDIPEYDEAEEGREDEHEG